MTESKHANDSQSIVFIYDGECPFCNKFASLTSLKSGIPNLTILDARTSQAAKNILRVNDIDIDQGALILIDDVLYQGALGINKLCLFSNFTDKHLIIIFNLMSSYKFSSLIYPFLLIARRVILVLKAVPVKIKL